MGAEASKPMEGTGLTAEILKLKQAREGGWLTEEEYDAELKRVIQLHSGAEIAQPAYGFEEVVKATEDAEQMKEWEKRYGPAATASPGPPKTPEDPAAPSVVAGATPGKMEMELVGGGEPELREPETPGGVELDLTGGGSAEGATQLRFGEEEKAVAQSAQGLSLEAGAASFVPGGGGATVDSPVGTEGEGGASGAAAQDAEADAGGGGEGPVAAGSEPAAEADAEEELVA